MIVVTGASGFVGGLVARELAARGEPVRLLVRDAGRAPALDGAEVVEADYGDPESLARALHAGDRVFMVSMHQGPERRVPLHRSFVDAAARAGVAHVVYLSFLAAGPDAVFLHARSHGATEQMLRESGLPWTAVRNGMYADDMLGWFDPDGVARETGGDGRMSFSYRPELAKAIAVTLTESGHEGKVYDVVTPPPVGLAELARHRVRGDRTAVPLRAGRSRRVGRAVALRSAATAGSSTRGTRRTRRSAPASSTSSPTTTSASPARSRSPSRR